MPPARAGAPLPILVLPLVLAVSGCSAVEKVRGSRHSTLQQALTFHASFDRGTDADFASGDSWLYQAPALDKARTDSRPGLPSGSVQHESSGGRHGGALHFTRRSEAVVFYKGKDNVAWKPHDWSGTVSFWLRADFATLATGFCDPVNITPKAWNDAAFFVEFEKRLRPGDVPFRLGSYPDYKVWNPKDRKWGEIPDAEKPLAGVEGPPFSGDRWTHVVFTWSHFNTGQTNGVALLYLDGAQVGAIRGQNQNFTWTPADVRIHLGVGYVGWLDDFAVFNRALDGSEVQQLRVLPNGVRSLYTP